MIFLLIIIYGICVVVKPEILWLEEETPFNLTLRRVIGAGMIVLGFFLIFYDIFG